MFMTEFEANLRKLHSRYRELENLNVQLSSMEKFTADIEAMIKQRDLLNKECSQIDSQLRVKQEEHIRLKKAHQEAKLEEEFLGSQLGAADLNKFKLENRHDELSENIRSLKDEIEEQENERVKAKT